MQVGEHVMRLTRPCRPTLYALSVCMNGRAAHFIMQTAIAYSAADGGVRQNMIESMNTHKYLEMIEIQETYKDILHIVIAEAGVSESGPQLTVETEPNETLRSILNESKAIEVGDDSQIYEILFEDYIAYAVTNESYAGGEFKEEYSGRLVRVYSNSAFLNYIKQGTIASSDYPGEFKHYGFCCLN